MIDDLSWKLSLTNNLMDFSIWENLNMCYQKCFSNILCKKKQILIPGNLLYFPCSLDTEFLA